jgi:hypothetical protein
VKFDRSSSDAVNLPRLRCHPSFAPVHVASAERSGNVFVVAWEQVAVPVIGHLNRRVPQPLLHNLGVGVVPDHERSSGMSEIMEPETKQVRFVAECTPHRRTNSVS